MERYCPVVHEPSGALVVTKLPKVLEASKGHYGAAVTKYGHLTIVGDRNTMMPFRPFTKFEPLEPLEPLNLFGKTYEPTHSD